MIVTAFVVYSLGLSPAFTLTTDMIVGTAPPERAGAASAISETGSELGGAVGIAILGSVGTAMYRGRMAHAAFEEARNTLGGAVAVAKKLHDSELLYAAREAFTASLRLTACVTVAVTLATAVLTALMLRQLR